MKRKFALVTLVVCAIVSPPLLAERPRVYALTGGTVSPGIYETLVVVGRELSLARMQDASDRASSGEFG